MPESWDEMGSCIPEGVIDSESLHGANALYDDDLKDQDNGYDCD